jgi:hypothetical protein
VVPDPKNSSRYYIVDTANNRIRLVDSGAISTAAGTTLGYSGDGGAATSAQLNAPAAMTIDSKGNLYIADTGNNCIRRVDAATGNIATVAGTGPPASGAGYAGDNGPATLATLNAPQGVAVDAAGNLYISDTGGPAGGLIPQPTRCRVRWLLTEAFACPCLRRAGNNVIRRVDAVTGVITTIAGTGTAGSTTGGTAITTGLNGPTKVCLEARLSCQPSRGVPAELGRPRALKTLQPTNCLLLTNCRPDSLPIEDHHRTRRQHCL